MLNYLNEVQPDKMRPLLDEIDRLRAENARMKIELTNSIEDNVKDFKNLRVALEQLKRFDSVPSVREAIKEIEGNNV
jgi:hypothetical protein